MLLHNPTCTGCDYCQNPFDPRPRKPLRAPVRARLPSARPISITPQKQQDFLSIVESVLQGSVRSFPLGPVLVTDKAFKSSSRSFKEKMLDLHATGDHGVVTDEVIRSNEECLRKRHGGVVSAYVAPDKTILIVATSLQEPVETRISALQEGSPQIRNYIDFSLVRR